MAQHLGNRGSGMGASGDGCREESTKLGIGVPNARGTVVLL